MSHCQHKERGVSEELKQAKEKFVKRWFPFRYGRPPGWHRLCTEEEINLRMIADLDKIIGEAVSHYCNKVKERYPEDVFPPDGNSLDCKSARMARLTCDNIIEEAKKEEQR